MAAKDTDDRKPDEQEAEISLDMSQAAVKKMIAEAREKGYITYDQLNQVLPPDQVSSEQIEDVMSMLSEMGINIIEDEEAEEEEQNKGSTEVWSPQKVLARPHTGRLYRSGKARPHGRSRYGCICAKWAVCRTAEPRGRDCDCEADRSRSQHHDPAGLCESPLTFQAITIWRDELLNEDILLRDVIDLEDDIRQSARRRRCCRRTSCR